MPARILLVEDEEPLLLLLRHSLEAEGYAIDVATQGDEAVLKIDEDQPDLVVLDWMIPGVAGIELCRRLRARRETAQLPIIMLTARWEESQQIRGLATGADDYIVKPFSMPELVARIRALLRRRAPERIARTLRVGDVELDRERCRVTRGGRQVNLPPTEFRLLEFLLQNPGRVFSRQQLLDGAWGLDKIVDERTVDANIRRLRKLLTRGREHDPIRTVRGLGYAFDEKVSEPD